MTERLLARSLPARAVGRVRCAAGEQAGAGGTVLVVVRCHGAVPAVLPQADLRVRVTARAVKEGR